MKLLKFFRLAKWSDLVSNSFHGFVTRRLACIFLSRNWTHELKIDCTKLFVLIAFIMVKSGTSDVVIYDV